MLGVKVRFEALLIRLNRLVCTSEDRLVLMVYGPVVFSVDVGKARVRLSVIVPPMVTCRKVVLAWSMEGWPFPPKVQFWGPVQVAELEMAMLTELLRL